MNACFSTSSLEKGEVVGGSASGRRRCDVGTTQRTRHSVTNIDNCGTTSYCCRE